MNTEADTCRRYIIPKLLALSWDSDPHFPLRGKKARLEN